MVQQTHEDIGTYLEQMLRQGQVKLEITGGTRTWRVLPSPRHQKMIDRIRASIEPGPHPLDGGLSCGCHHLADVQIRFPDGSFKRPDIALFCVEPPDSDTSLEMVPEAVVEIVSLDYEEKDLSINPPWYLSQGVKDVLVADPRNGYVVHFSHRKPASHLALPQTIDLLCGCRVTIS